MGTKTRIQGADAVLRGITEVSYGIAPTSGYKLLSFKSTALDSERLLGSDPLLGQGRDAADPFYEAINVDGDIGVPLDVQGLGFWLTGLFGTTATTGAYAMGDRHPTGGYTFAANPTASDNLTLGATSWTFVATGATGNQTNLKTTLRATLAQLVFDLNSSANTIVDDNTYTGDDLHLYIYNKTGGAGGNSYTTTASTTSITPFATALSGGTTAFKEHVWSSGYPLPSKSLEVGHPQLVTAQFLRYTGCKFGTFAFDLARTGPANATINVIAQKRTDAATTIDTNSTGYTLIRFSQGSGGVFLNNFQIANITGGRVEFTNTLEAVETIRADGLIDGADEGEARCTGSVTVRAGTDTALSAAVAAQTPVKMEYSFSVPVTGSAHVFRVTLPRVFLPKPKSSITGPGGVEQTFDWQAAKDSSLGLAKMTLINDITSEYS